MCVAIVGHVERREMFFVFLAISLVFEEKAGGCVTVFGKKGTLLKAGMLEGSFVCFRV